MATFQEGRAIPSPWRLELLDQGDLVAPVVVAELVDQPTGEHDAEAPLADAQLVADVEVADRVFLRGGVGELAGLKPGPWSPDDQGDRSGSIR